MKSISLQSSQSTGLDPLLASPRTIGVEDTPLGQGGFGVVYRGVQVDGRMVRPLAVKLFLDNAPEAARRGLETIEELQRRLAVEHQRCTRANLSLLDEYPALAAAPLLSFHGHMEGRAVIGYAATDLSAIGLEEFASILEDDAKIASFQALSLPAKMDLAHQLASALEFLHSKIGFLHCDLKAEALFIGTRPPHCVLIDYDGGAVMRAPDDVPTTWGTRQDWLAPEILAQMQQASVSEAVEVSLASELWSGAIAVHHLLFGFHPMFFLSEISERSIHAYTQRFEWPEIETRFAYFRKGMEKIQATYVRYLHSAFPAELLRHFCFTIGQGYANPAQRTTFSQWKTALGAANRPAILRFEADRTVVRDARPVRLAWEVTGAKRIEIAGVGEVTGQASIEVAVRQSHEFELILTPQMGSQITQKLKIQVDDRPPRIHAFYADRQIVEDARPVDLTWSVSGADRVEIEPAVGDITAVSHCKVSPMRDTTYVLKAVSGLGMESRVSLTLCVSRKAPLIHHFRVSPLFAGDGDEVELDWKVTGAETVSLEPGIGAVPAEGRRKVRVLASKDFTLRSATRFGVNSSRTLTTLGLKRTVLVKPRTSLHAGTNLMRAAEGTPVVGHPERNWSRPC
jgi:serine/threonine protein kinase